MRRNNHKFWSLAVLSVMTLTATASSEKSAGKVRLDSLYSLYNDCYYANDVRNERRYIDELMHEAETQNDVDMQTRARRALLYYYYNQDLDDSLLLEFPRQHSFFRAQQQWKTYYDTWATMVNHYIFTGSRNQALREVKLMYKDAQTRENNYGIGIASYGLGNAYMDMGYNEEAAKAYERSLRILPNVTEGHVSTILDIYPYYCSVLADQQQYQQMLKVTDLWHQYLSDNIDRLGVDKDKADQTIYYTYYFNSRATALIGLQRFEEAEQLLMKAYENTKEVADNSQLSVIYNLGLLYTKWGDNEKAMRYNDRLMHFYDQPDDPVGLLLAKKQRAEILLQSHRYAEAAPLYRDVYLLADSLNLNDVKNQLNEFNTLFKVDEMEKEQQQARTRNNYIIFGLIIGSLIIIGLVGMALMRRLRQKNRELAVALDHANESDRMKTAFVQHISHEIRTPLNVVTGFAQIISNPDYKLSAEDRDKMLNDISRNTREITSFVSELLEFSENESHNHYELTDSVNINALCREVISGAEVVNAGRLQLGFETMLNDDFTLCSNEDALRKVLGQLVKNGMKFTEKGHVTLCAALSDNQKELQLTVTDTGIGIPKELHEKIFEKFYKVDSFKQGLGLGLTMARHITSLLGGNLTLDASYVEGTRFLLTLPLEVSQHG